MYLYNVSHTRLSFRIQKPFHYLSNCAVWLNVPLGSVGPPYKSLLSYVHLNCTRFSQNSNARQPKPLGGTALSRILCIFAFDYKCFTGGYFLVNWDCLLLSATAHVRQMQSKHFVKPFKVSSGGFRTADRETVWIPIPAMISK